MPAPATARSKLFTDFSFSDVVAASHVVHISARDGRFFDENGNDIDLKGVNWYGFNTPKDCMVSGVWVDRENAPQGNNERDGLAVDFKTTVWRMKLLGFNAVRLSFSFRVRRMPQSVPPYTFITT